jgi:hypothetical protein
MTGANTLTFDEIDVGVNIFDKAALILSRLEYDPAAASLQDLDDDGDQIVMGLTASNNISSLSPNQAEVIDRVMVLEIEQGTPANFVHFTNPIVHDFSGLPGGGLLIPPKPLYLAAYSSGMTVAGVVDIRMYFRILRLEASQYLELLETRRAFG